MALAEYSPLEVKMSVVGYGRAEKSQVQLMVASLLRLPEPLDSEDACDALAIAICHATHARFQQRDSRLRSLWLHLERWPLLATAAEPVSRRQPAADYLHQILPRQRAAFCRDFGG